MIQIHQPHHGKLPINRKKPDIPPLLFFLYIDMPLCEYFCVPLQQNTNTFFMLTDIEIAKSVKLRPINEVAAELGIHEDQVENYGQLHR